ncbi:hypothetical protein [[Mycobacterium] fortunisiensis]
MALCMVVALCGGTVLGGPAGADPPGPVGQEPPPPPLPVIVPTASDWQPMFPFPYDQTREFVTDADINAQREMCQWYNAQYEELMRQIDRFNIKLISRNGNWNIDDIPAHADAVVANIDQSVAFLAPRTQALTQRRDYVGDNYFPLYQGESFFLMWQHLSNVGNGLRARQPAWFSGPSLRRVQYWGSRINRSHVCR